MKKIKNWELDWGRGFQSRVALYRRGYGMLSKMDAFTCFFRTSKLYQPTNFEPVDQRKDYIHHLEALKEENLTQYFKMGVEGQNIWRIM